MASPLKFKFDPRKGKKTVSLSFNWAVYNRGYWPKRHWHCNTRCVDRLRTHLPCVLAQSNQSNMRQLDRLLAYLAILTLLLLLSGTLRIRSRASHPAPGLPACRTMKFLVLHLNRL